MCAGTDRSWATGRQSLKFSGRRRAWYLTGDLASVRGKIMTYVMTKPCPICKRQLTKQGPTDTVNCPAVNMFGRDSTVGHKKALRGFLDLGPSCQWIGSLACPPFQYLHSAASNKRLC